MASSILIIVASEAPKPPSLEAQLHRTVRARSGRAGGGVRYGPKPDLGTDVDYDVEADQFRPGAGSMALDSRAEMKAGLGWDGIRRGRFGLPCRRAGIPSFSYSGLPRMAVYLSRSGEVRKDDL